MVRYAGVGSSTTREGRRRLARVDASNGGLGARLGDSTNPVESKTLTRNAARIEKRMDDSSSIRGFVDRLRRWWLALERGWQAVVLAYLVVALVVLAP